MTNKLLLACAGATAAILLGSTAPIAAQNSISASPSTFSISSASGFFDVTLSLSTSASNISAFDLFLQSVSPNINSGNFSISLTSAVIGATAAAAGQNPDAISTTSPYSNSGARATNGVDQGFSYSADQTITGGNFTLETLRISYSFSSLPSAGTSFTFTTTPSGLGGAPGTYFYSNNFATFNTINTPASFTVSVVPEPSTYTLVGCGILAMLTAAGWRRRLTQRATAL